MLLHCTVVYCVILRCVIILYCIGVGVDGVAPLPPPRSGIGSVVVEGCPLLLLLLAALVVVWWRGVGTPPSASTIL